MQGRKIALLVVVAVGAALAGAAPAQADGRERAESLYNDDPEKTATATCPHGQVVKGAGGRIVDGYGGVRLDAIVPTLTTVTARGQAFADHEGSWKVVAVAVCTPESDGLAQATTIEAGTSTATCPGGTDLSSAGYDLSDGTVLTGLIPDPGAGSVTVRTPTIVIGGDPTTAYAICVPEQPPTYTRMLQDSTPADQSSPKQIVLEDWQLTGGGGQVTWVDTGPGPHLARSDVFIDTLIPSDDLRRVTVQAVDRTPVVARAALAGDEWSLTGFALNPYYY